MIAISKAVKPSIFDELNCRMQAIKNSMFTRILENRISELPFSESFIEYQNSENCFIKTIDHKERERKAVVVLGKGGKIHPCQHLDADEKLHVIKGQVKNSMTGQTYKEGETYLIPKSEPHGFISEEGCEILLTWNLV